MNRASALGASAAASTIIVIVCWLALRGTGIRENHATDMDNGGLPLRVHGNRETATLDGFSIVEGRRHRVDREEAILQIALTDAVTGSPITKGAVSISASAACGPVHTVPADRRGVCAVSVKQGCALEGVASAAGYFSSEFKVLRPSLNESLPVSLQRAGHIRVRVLDIDGSPISGAYVDVAPEALGSPKGRADKRPPHWPEFFPVPPRRNGRPQLELLSLTGVDGNYDTPELPCATSLVVTARLKGAVCATTVAIPADAAWALIEMRLPQDRCMKGRLVWNDGKAARLSIQSLEEDATGRTPMPVQCLPDGTFELCGLRRGENRWRVVLPGETSRVVESIQALTDVGDIAIASRHKTEVQLTHGTSQGPPDFSAFGADIVQQGNEVDHSMFNKDGLLELLLPSGPTTINVTRREGWLTSVQATVPCARIVIPVADITGELCLINSSFSNTSKFAIHLQPVGELGDRNVRHQARPAVSYNSWSTTTPLQWRGNDLFVTMLVPGSYDILLAVNDGYAVRIGNAVIAAGRTSTLSAALEPMGSLQVTLRNSAGEVVAGLDVVAAIEALDRSTSNRQRIERRTDSVGRASWTSLPSGRWLVFPKTSGPESDVAQSVDVLPSVATELQIVVEMPGSLRGKVLSIAGPVEGATVTIQGWGDPLSQQSKLIFETNKGGDFYFDQLVPGTYSVSAFISNTERGGLDCQLVKVVVMPAAEAFVEIAPTMLRRRLIVTRKGHRLSGYGGGLMVNGEGHSSVAPVPGSEGVFVAKINKGPAVLMLEAPRQFAILDSDRTPPHFAFGYIGQIQKGTDDIAIDLNGVDVVVDARASGSPLPRMRLVSIGGLGPVFGAGDPCRFVYEDEEPGVRRFSDVPYGATVELVTDPTLGPLRSYIIEAGQGGPEIRVTWPPR